MVLNSKKNTTTNKQTNKELHTATASRLQFYSKFDTCIFYILSLIPVSALTQMIFFSPKNIYIPFAMEVISVWFD
jgi:hypothetical protein